ncbi:hypothetical protein [Streptomyces sp. NPDC056975]|uniref:hypothetical protein n=1 Tax=unclassified Streptomyces TaxID=2593676 RepID=UPI00363BF542
MNRPTARDVAELAGVSRAAVSFVFSGRAQGSPLAGIGYDSVGFAPTYLLIAATVAAFTTVSVATLRPDAKGLPESVPDVPASGRGTVPEPASL